MKKLHLLGCLCLGVLLIMAAALVSCESSDNFATLTIDNRSGEWLKIFLDTQPQQDSSPDSIQIIGVDTNAHLLVWEGQKTKGEVTVTVPQGKNMTLKIYGGLTDYELQ